MLLTDDLKKALAAKIESLSKEMYEEGYKHGKQKQAKRTFFRSWF